MKNLVSTAQYQVDSMAVEIKAAKTIFNERLKHPLDEQKVFAEASVKILYSVRKSGESSDVRNEALAPLLDMLYSCGPEFIQDIQEKLQNLNNSEK